VNHDEILSRLDVWVRDDDNIRAAVVTGSLARGQGDELSDVDLELYVREPAALLATDDWYRRFGDVLVVEALPNAGWNPTRLVYYVDGKIDFTVMACETARRTEASSRASLVLVDKDAMLDRLAPDAIHSVMRPTQSEFDTCNNWFYAAAIMCAKCLVRDELWSAKFRDTDAKAQLLRMIEWDHKARYGWSYDTWHNASHMHEWMDDDIVEALDACWAGLAAEPATSALRATVTLFGKINARTASTLGLEPFDSAAAAAEVQRILSLRA
jgi:aminoglycoside 6-adenylyltransferase